jgi:hypothetical protein
VPTLDGMKGVGRAMALGSGPPMRTDVRRVDIRPVHATGRVVTVASGSAAHTSARPR